MGLLRSILEWEIDFKTKNFVYRKDILISFCLCDRKLSSELVGAEVYESCDMVLPSRRIC